MCFFDGGVVFSITVSLEAYLRVILVDVLRSRCYADAIRIEEGFLSSLYTLTRNFGEHRLRESDTFRNSFLFYIPPK